MTESSHFFYIIFKEHDMQIKPQKETTRHDQNKQNQNDGRIKKLLVEIENLLNSITRKSEKIRHLFYEYLDLKTIEGDIPEKLHQLFSEVNIKDSDKKHAYRIMHAIIVEQKLNLPRGEVPYYILTMLSKKHEDKWTEIWDKAMLLKTSNRKYPTDKVIEKAKSDILKTKKINVISPNEIEKLVKDLYQQVKPHDRKILFRILHTSNSDHLKKCLKILSLKKSNKSKPIYVDRK